MNPQQEIEDTIDDGGMRYISKTAASTSGGFTFPALDANLTKEIIDGCGLRPGLEKFSELLVEAMKVRRPDAVGVILRSISFTVVLGKSKEEAVAEVFLK